MSALPITEARAVQMATSLADKLKLARQATQKSTRVIADIIAKRFPKQKISHATIANYEKGRSSPPIDVLSTLAELYERPINWFLQTGTALSGIRYRNLKSKVRVGDRHWYEANAQRWIEAYFRIEDRLGKRLVAKHSLTNPTAEELPREFAMRVRRELGFRSGEPIPSVVEILESLGVHVIELPTDLSIDGLAAKYGHHPVVVLNPKVPNDRTRMNAAHELAHLLYKDCDDATEHTKAIEQRAFDWASHLLLPHSQLKEAFTGRSMVKLVKFKERFGISMAAMVYRAEKTSVISKVVARKLWIEFAKRGWKTDEPGSVRPDRATRLEQLIDSATFKGTMNERDAAHVAGVREEEIRERIRRAMGHHDLTFGQDDAGAQAVIQFRN